MPTALPETRPETDTRTPVPWNVVLLNDESHTYEYVIRMMQRLFGHSLEKALAIAHAVDTQGRAICLTTHKEHAELKREQVRAFGPDPLMAESAGPMSAVIEPAELGSDDGPGTDGP